ncbi:hypothetical protein [Pseudoxanthomonas sp. 10H]|uniref:hypothetical protein n=1 Tax=Pseudoxanthomonas sp. 10H TaxID=3242729 RepID=UPI003556AC6A
MPGKYRASHVKPNKGYPAILKLLLLVGGLLALASHLGNRMRDPPDHGQAPAPLSDARATVDPAPSITIPKPQAAAGPTRVDNASISASADGSTIYIDGGIGETFFEDLERTVDANPFVQRIVLTSGGGYAGPGLEAASLIRRKNLTVRVKSHCASMCVGLWAAAAAREMEPDAVIGLHQWRATCDSFPEAQRKECEYRSQFMTEHDASYDGWLRSAGFSDRMLRLQEATASSDVALFVVPQLWEEGVDFRVVDANGNYMGREATLKFLQTRYGRKRG